MSLCPQCHLHSECSKSGLPDQLIRNILFMSTSIEEKEDLQSLVTILYDEQLREYGTDSQEVLAVLNPIVPRCPYLQ